MRKYKFRGYNKTLNKWIYGDLIHNHKEDIIQIQNQLGNRFTVDKNSIGQYTECNDKDGNEIYEGDILDRYLGKEHICGKVVFENGRYGVLYKENFWSIELYMYSVLNEVIGNVYENPNILGGK
ncbi:MAG: YopX family protein [Sarcina sp.]